MAHALRNLQTNAESLSNETEALQCMKQDLQRRVNECLSSDPYNELSSQVEHWFQSVGSFLHLSTTFAESFAARVPSCSIKCGCWSNYKLAKRAVELLEQARNLASEGKSFADEQLVVPSSEKIPSSLEAKAESLSRKTGTVRSLMVELDSKFSHLLLKHQRVERSDGARRWFENVEGFLKSSEEFAESFVRRARRPFVELVREADELLEDACTLIEDGTRFEVDDHQLIKVVATMVDEVPIYPPMVGQEVEFSRALDLINGDEASVIGICGMGGLGKTTLLRKISNYFCRNPSSGFDVVVMVTVSKDMDAVEIQERLIQKLGLSTQGRGESKSMILHDFLDVASFLLLMDGVWDRLELAEIGIPPLRTKKQKVVMATRSKQVCYDMEASDGDIVEMELLSPDLSWELFSLHVVNKDLLDDPSIKPLAREVANRCRGLPLAISIIGRTMMRAREAREWRNAKMELKQLADAFQGMDRVLFALKFSFDRLENDALREVLLYCSFYPKGHNMSKEYLIELLIAEGFFDTIYARRELARIRAQGMISRLVDAGLLIQQEEDSIQLHDCVHDMAVWLIDGEQDKSSFFLRWSPRSQSGEDLPGFFNRWQQAKRISMVCSNLEEIPGGVLPNCGKLLTLLWEMGKVVNIDEQFFTCMPYLRVLNLSNCAIREIPRSIGHLTCLKYLNMESTQVKRLPEEMGDLQQLVQLILRYTLGLYYIPYKSISRLSKLETLDILGSNYDWSWFEEEDSHQISNRTMTLRDLEDLTGERLCNVAISIKEPLLRSLVDYTTLISSITRVELHSIYEMDLSLQNIFLRILSERIKTLAVNNMRKLEIRVRFQSLCKLSLKCVEELRVKMLPSYHFPMLSYLHLILCQGVEDLTWVAQIPSLEVLRVEHCENLHILFSQDETSPSLSMVTPLSCLKELTITSCKSLSLISGEALLFPSLEMLRIRSCKELKKLPFNEQSANNLVAIRGLSEWWNELEWDDEDAKAKFLPYFFPSL